MVRISSPAPPPLDAISSPVLSHCSIQGWAAQQPAIRSHLSCAPHLGAAGAPYSHPNGGDAWLGGPSAYHPPAPAPASTSTTLAGAPEDEWTPYDAPPPYSAAVPYGGRNTRGGRRAHVAGAERPPQKTVDLLEEFDAGIKRVREWKLVGADERE